MADDNIAPLGFAIPTYRRPLLLDLALQSVVAQARLLAAPIYVPDNSCDRTNVEVVAKWKAVHPHIVHELNEDNLGIDRNVDRAIIRCPAVYVHVIGDDDVIFPGFAEHVLSVIDASAPGHIVCSYKYLSNDYRPITGKGVIPADRPLSSMRALLPRHGWTLGFIGAHVFRRDRFLSGSVDGFGTYFHHIVRLVSYLDPDEPLGFVGKPLVGNRADDESTPTWSGDRLAVVFGLERALAAAMQGRYAKREIDDAVAATRRNLGYTQFFRLLYWAALAERSGNEEKYWASLERLVPTEQYKRVRSVPSGLYRPLLEAIPVVRRMKRWLEGAEAARRS